MERNSDLKISVVIPMYNAEKSIIRTLESVRCQNYKGDIEVVVVNDGSKDNSLKVVKDYKENYKEFDIKIVDQVNGGVSKARNAGIKNSNGEFIAFLDSDDAWFENKISIQYDVFEKNKEIDFLAGGFDGLYFNNRKKGELIKIGLKDLVYKNYFQPSTVMMKKEIVDKIGYFDENQKYAEEGNYFIRIADKYNCYFLNEKMINYGDGKSGFGHSGLSANIVEMQKGFQKNLKYAYENKFISLPTYISAVAFSKLKYIRRVLIVKFIR